MGKQHQILFAIIPTKPAPISLIPGTILSLAKQNKRVLLKATNTAWVGLKRDY